MDIKCDIEIKEELLDNTQDDTLSGCHLDQEEILEGKECPNSEVKCWVEVNDDPLDIKEKNPSIDQTSQKISGLDENQVRVKKKA
ncbi:hypothetical protein Avbf_09045 [Armadillidium vulgare]|nr:hypothetical protein Avbf_09045 [Armadillidium vulgare]